MGLGVVGRRRPEQVAHERAQLEGGPAAQGREAAGVAAPSINDWLSTTEATGLPDASARFPVGRKHDCALVNRLEIDSSGHARMRAPSMPRPSSARAVHC